MGRRLLLFALASVLMLGCTGTTPAVGASSLCLNTTCREDNGYFALPLESLLHPDRPANGVGTCTPCADAGTLSPCTGNCTRCCYKRTCADYDGLGTPYCPYGFDATAGPGNVAVTSGDDSIARFSKCCTATTPNSFPAPSATIAGGVQAIAPSQTNWGFLEDTNTSPYVSYKGRLTGMCFKVTANRSCDASANPECCNAAAKPAVLQLKLPVPAALSGAGADSSPRYQALSQLSRCGLWFGRPNGRAVLRARWRFTDQDAADGQAAGTAEVDARYMTLPLHFGVAGEARMCVYVADVIEDRDCSWENLCGLKDSDPVGYVGNATLGIVMPASPKRRLGCEVRLVGAAAVRLGNTVTSRCVGLTHTVTGFSSVRQHCGGWNYPCGNSSVCSDTRDGFTCACAAGYESITDNGRNCVDVDECSAAINPCGSNSRCNNTDGNYTCACETGYSSPTNNSRNCVAVCSCYNGGTCDVVGVCNCPSGYTGNICQTTATSGSTTDTWYYSGAARRRRSLLAAAEDATAIELAYVTAYQNALPAANLQVVAVAERAQAAGLQSQTQRRLQGVAGDWVVTVTVSPDPSSGITLDVLSSIVSSPAFPHEVVQQLSQMPESPVQGGGVCQTDSSGVCSDAAPQFTVDPGTGGVSTNDNECNNRGAFKGGVCTCNQGYAGATCAYKLMSGLSYAGTDIPSGPLACDTSACCADNCTSTAGCTAFVWKGASGDCFLKQGLTTPSLEAGAVTGITYGTSMCWPNCCINGGVATSDGSCSCAGTGFTGATCNVSLCSLPETCNAALTASCSKGVCTCKQGYGGVDCSLDIDECSAANRANFCDTSDVATCTNSVGSYFCICKSGYTSTNGGKTCTDVNECSDTATCGASSGAGNCTNSPGSYSCSCSSGWTFNGITCVDVNECSNTTTCGVSSGAGTCTNSAGSYSCSCSSGWTFASGTCVDVNECSNTTTCGASSGAGTCTNSPGSYSCSCNSGWMFDGITCVDTCTLAGTCSTNGTASCLAGVCTCKSGYTGSKCSQAACTYSAMWTVAGTGAAGYTLDGVKAIFSQVNARGTHVSADGTLLIADAYNHRIRVVDPTTGLIRTFAGTGLTGTVQDNVAATSSNVRTPFQVAVDRSGNTLIADSNNNRVRQVAAQTGLISTVAGTGNGTYNGNNISATSANLNYVTGVAVDSVGNIFLSALNHHIVRRVDAATGLITTVAGTGTSGFNGDNIAATSAQLWMPYHLAISSDDRYLYIADYNNHRVRRVDLQTGIITTAVGTGSTSYNGDNFANTTNIYYPMAVAVDVHGNVYTAHYSTGGRLRRVDAITNRVTTIAGNGATSGVGTTPTTTAIYAPCGISVSATTRDVFVTDYNGKILRVFCQDPCTTGVCNSTGTASCSNGVCTCKSGYSGNDCGTADKTLPMVSGSNGGTTSFSMTCNSRSFVTSIGGYYNTYLYAIGPVGCSDGTSISTVAGTTQGWQFTSSSASGFSGFTAFSGSWYDAVTFIYGTGGTSMKYGGSGGNPGGAISRCPTGTLAGGVYGRWSTSTATITALGFVCR